ncbi:MAG: TPM domain-containing protein [Neisseria sp.]|nr:TPM domain-containing protein [Neisseria sp.]
MGFFSKIKRLFAHLFHPSWRVENYFPQRSLTRLQAAIADSEQQHLGQIRFVVESGWNAGAIWDGKTPRERALEWFGLTRAWDTARNTGVLLYVSFADHAIEIIADRGLVQRIDNRVWEKICQDMRPLFIDKSYIVGLELGLDAIHQVLCRHFPRGDEAFQNELSDEVIVR